jgi:hypothetical protein
MPDDMFFVSDRRSLRRGRRVAKRTETCRPCLVWLKDEPEDRHYGVALDISPHGMRIRMMDALPEAAVVMVQMMRDEEFTLPLTEPIEGIVARSTPEPTGFIDHGIRLAREMLKRVEPRPVPAATPLAARGRQPRMYTLDITVGDRRRGRAGR